VQNRSIAIIAATDRSVPVMDTPPAISPRVIKTKTLFKNATEKASRDPIKISVAMTATLARPYRSGTGAGKCGNIPSSNPKASAVASMTAERVSRRTDTDVPRSRDKIDILPFR
jgi:hypothetical protein